MNPIERASITHLINAAARIVFLGGAGVSTASGIPDFRSATGLYNQERQTKYAPETLLSYHFMVRHPEEFYAYLRENLHYPQAEPNQAHFSLARLEAAKPNTNVITQNIDGLHQKAGSRNVLEIHGNIERFYCLKCGHDYSSALVWELSEVPRCPVCGGLIRPDVVLYGELLDEELVEQAHRTVSAAELMIIGGTSLVVYPAAGLIHYFRGKNLILINRDPTPYDSIASFVLHGDLGQILNELIT